jgi:hypothetical protein
LRVALALLGLIAGSAWAGPITLPVPARTRPVLSNPARISWTFWPEECVIPSWPTIPDWVQNMLF